MLRFVCFAAVVVCALGQHMLYPGDPGYEAPGYQGAQAYQGYQGAPSYQGAQGYQGAQAYQGAPAYQAQAQPNTATNYRLEDGQQRLESRDNEGNVKGEYSYVDPNGRTLTVKYTAGKDGYRVEGDHLPQSPAVPAPAGPASQGQYNAYQQSQSRAPHQFPQVPAQSQYQQYQPQPQPQYNPQAYQQNSLSGFSQGQQHRFGNSQQSQSPPGVSLSVDPAGGGGYNYQYNL